MDAEPTLFYRVRQYAMDLLAWMCLWIYGGPYTFRAIRAMHNPEQDAKVTLDNARELDMLLESAKNHYSEARDRRAIINDKARSLITLLTATLAIVAAFLTRQSMAMGFWTIIVFYIGVFSLFISFLVMWSFYSLRYETTMEINNEEVTLDSVNLQKSMINDYIQSTSDSHIISGYLADLYGASRLFFINGFSIILIIICFDYSRRLSISDPETMVRQINVISNDNLHRHHREIDSRADKQNPRPEVNPALPRSTGRTRGSGRT